MHFVVRLLIFLVLSCYQPCFAQSFPRYVVAEEATPVLNTPEFAAVFGGVNGKFPSLDACGKERALEFVALPGTVFEVEAQLQRNNLTIFRVTTGDYPYPTQRGYYVDSRFVVAKESRPPERLRRLPSREMITDSLRSAVGSRYVWGGNLRVGVAPPDRMSGSVDASVAGLASLRGVDCSGLLYEATGGYIPRNSSSLTSYGQPVAVAGLSPKQIVERLQPLDLIVWNGHVLIVLDRGQLIESRLECKGAGGGVRLRGIEDALSQIMKNRAPMNVYVDPVPGKGFVVRRWFTDAMGNKGN